ncbi:ABC transporter ATP-binding protein/permease [Streptosporangium sp. NBC_01639]|uniref:ABC transporter ATP-binding protein n=1 Tax=Streptosporangium sp. NBC_01639 TaxID=2975948 RepID=UPI003869F4FA|nr:ABC transporter ATP-binding protein/permease [Streptosporangium sp. NBC_01639]
MTLLDGGHRPQSASRPWRDKAIVNERIAPGTLRRIAAYGRPYRAQLATYLLLVTVQAATVIANPLLIKKIIDDGIGHRQPNLVIGAALTLAGLAVLEATLGLAQRWHSAKLGEGLIHDLRTETFDHVQRMPVAFFMRTQTGALVSRLNTDVIGAQRALTTTLSSLVSNVISLILVLAAMLTLSWQITLAALLLLPIFLLPAKYVGARLSKLTREQMRLNAERSSVMTERFNVAGAILAKLYGRPGDDTAAFAARAAQTRDVSVTAAMYGVVLRLSLGLTTALAIALIYGAGGLLAVGGPLELGTVVALAALLARLQGPVNGLSNVQVDVMTALVSFERVFEILDLAPSITDRPDARPIPSGPTRVEFDKVRFGYPAASEVSLASLETMTGPDTAPTRDVLRGVSFTAKPGELIAIVGHSGAGKTTIASLLTRLYDVTEGTVRINGLDVRHATTASLRDTIGVITQDAHLFHDTIGANLRYARPQAGDEEIWAALEAAQIDDLVRALPDGLDTVAGDRGHRLSGGEKQRLALARLLLKAPSVVVLDEATAHLDAGSEAAVQQALKTVLAGRTALVIAHRLATIRDADQILVIQDGRIVESGRHEKLLAEGGVYAELYHTQFSST